FAVAAVIKLVAGLYLLLVWWLALGSLETMIEGVESDITALFISGFIVCFPPLFVLGMYAPLSVSLLLREPGDAGKISGGLFAISSLGNIVGILVTTFWRIPSVGSRAITLGFATFLLASAIVSTVVS